MHPDIGDSDFDWIDVYVQVAKERETIRRHPEIGYRIASSSPGLLKVADLILRYHENYDG